MNISRIHLRRRIAAYNQGGIRAPEHLQAMMTVKRKKTFIVDKPDHEKTQAELIEALRYMQAENDYPKELKALRQKEAAAKKAKPSKH